MMNDSPFTPPKWLDRLLSLFCKEDIIEILQGDLHELYERNTTNYGRRKANLLYIKDTLTAIRPTLLKPLEGNHQLNTYGMFKNHFKTSLRNSKRNPVFSFINTFGLALSLTVGITMIIFLSELYSVDDFIEKRDNIYRVTTTQPGLMGNQIDHLATASYFIADRAAAELPEVENVLVMSWKFQAEVESNQKRVALSGFYTTPSFLEVLSYPLISGNAKTALSKPESVILTRAAAARLFHSENPIGQRINLSGVGNLEQGVVTGVMENPPANSYLDFEILMPMASNPMISTAFRNNPNNTFEHYVYLLLKDLTDPTIVEEKIASILADHPNDMSRVTHKLEPMGSFVTGASMNANGPTFTAKKVDMMIILTLIVLLSACFNYTNLSLGRSLRRVKEISIRKMTGATRLQLFTQFMFEAILISFAALIMGLGLFLLFKPAILDQMNYVLQHRDIFTLDITLMQLGYFLLFTCLIGVIAGLFPALVLSRLDTNFFLLFGGKVRLLSAMNARKALITFQFSLSIGLIMCAVMVYQQYQFSLNFNLGYETENIVNVPIKGDYMELLEKDYSALPQVLATSRSQSVLGLRGGQFGNAISENFMDTTMYASNQVGSSYFQVHKFKILAGETFSTSLDQNEVIVNERLIKALSINSPEAAIGQKIRLWDEQGTIVSIRAVVQDFTGVSLDFQMPEPFVFFPLEQGQNGTLGLKVQTDDLLATMRQLEALYQKYDPIHPFQAQLYDDQISANYQQLKSSYTIISLLAILAISISTLGLIGIAIYTVESKMKEISIRKVLGASTKNLIRLLSRGFAAMILIAGFLAIPISLHVVDTYLLQNFFYRTTYGFLELASGFLVVLIIATIAVGSQVRKVSVSRPTDLLRDE